MSSPSHRPGGVPWKDPGSIEGQLYRLLAHPPPGTPGWEGKALARALGLGRPVSRAVLWKRVESLRKLRYRVVGSPESGYRLAASPDVPYPWEIRDGLKAGRMGREMVFYSATDSTNARAKVLAEAGAPEGTVVAADRQWAGRGRMGRRWHSPAGVNLYLTVLLRPPLPPSRVPPIALVAAVATARALEGVGVRPDLKWPNDLFVEGRKVSGILAELSAEADRVDYVLLGIGVNVNEPLARLPAEIRAIAGSLRASLGRGVGRVPLARGILSELDQLYGQYLREGFAPLRRQWERRSTLWGKTVRVEIGPRSLVGTAVSLDDGGALLVRVGRRLERVLAGDVVRVPSPGEEP